jgi:hydroxyacylglutathione hydrolase
VPSTTEIARRYFEALDAHDLSAVGPLWAPGGISRIAGQAELSAPHGIIEYFDELFAAFPDFRFQVVETTTYRNRCAVRWRGTGTFAGPGYYQGFRPNGAQVLLEGCDVVSVSADGLITTNEAYVDSMSVARQLGFLPPSGSSADTRLATLMNLRTRLGELIRGAEPEIIAPGVWIVRGGRPRTMNVYLIEDGEGVTVFDAGIKDMTVAVRAAAARLGGIRRVVLGHADCDHRGAAAGLEAPVLCHPLEREAAQSPDSLRDYWRLERLSPLAQRVYPRLLRMWDGDRVQIADTVSEGDELAGFRVVELPGHAPGLIGLFRESDRLALVSDCFYTINPETGRRRPAGLPHPAFNHDSEQARESIRKLAGLRPAVAWAGHADPVAGDDVEAQLMRAAADPA